jgi:hypothetical protein
VKLIKKFKELQGCQVIGLTGTVMQNNHAELWTVFNIVEEDLFGPWYVPVVVSSFRFYKCGDYKHSSRYFGTVGAAAFTLELAGPYYCNDPISCYYG